MPLPLIFIIPIAATGLVGAGKTAKGFIDSNEATRITNKANTDVDTTKNALERSRTECADSLQKLGDVKLDVLNGSITRFINSFEKIKNLDLTESLGLEELRKFHIDRKSLSELKELQKFAVTVAGGIGAGIAGGALTAFGAYSAALTLATASTGTAISALNGVAATNATLAFFGGGALSAGGAGMAGGVTVLGGFVAGPALLVMGFIVGKKADEKLELAKTNEAQAREICEDLNNAAYQCDAIRRRTYMFYTFLARLDAQFMPLVFQLENVLSSEGDDYSSYSDEAKSTVLRSATLACSIKAILDTPILTEEGSLTDESLKLTETLGITFNG